MTVGEPSSDDGPASVDDDSLGEDEEPSSAMDTNVPPPTAPAPATQGRLAKLRPTIASQVVPTGSFAHLVPRYKHSVLPVDFFAKLRPDLTSSVLTTGILINLVPRYKDSVLPADFFAKLRPDLTSSIFTTGILINLVPKYKDSVLPADFFAKLRPDLTSSIFTTGILSKLAEPHISPELRANFRELLRRVALPSNLRSISNVTSDEVLEFTLNHGIAIYVVPRPSIARSLLAAQTSQAVRRILGTKSAEIVADCRRVLEACDQPETLDYRRYGLQAIEALELGAYAPAQALTANLLDGLLSKRLEANLASAAKRRQGETISDAKARIHDLDVWQGYIAAALWSTFAHYYRSRGDVVPHSFSRHATVHAAGPRQYSRRSAVQGIMAVTAAVAYINGLQ